MNATYATLFAKYGFHTSAWLRNACHIVTKEITPTGTGDLYHMEIQVPLDNGKLIVTIYKITDEHQEVLTTREAVNNTSEAHEAIAAAISVIRKLQTNTLTY
jgi:hypothetical protein